jgi:predicted porin
LAAATGSFAQSTVALSGSLALTAGNVAYGGAPTRQDIGRASGAITLAGTEDLGGGLKASFTVQQGMYGWTTAGGAASTSLNGNSLQNFGDRQMFATLSGGFGTVKIGRDLNGASSVVLGAGNVSGVKAITGFDDSGKDAVYVGNVRSTSVSYATPSFGGFSAYVGVTPQNYAGLVAGSASTTVTDGTNGIVALATPGAASTKQNTPSAVGAVYANGPLTAAVDFTNYQEALGTTNAKVTSVAANYDLGVAKIGAIYQTSKSDTKANTNSYVLSASVPVSAALSLGVGYGVRKATVNGSFSANETKHTQLGANYALSKRTTAYIAYSNKAVNGSTVSANDAKETGVGIAHTF